MRKCRKCRKCCKCRKGRKCRRIEIGRVARCGHGILQAPPPGTWQPPAMPSYGWQKPPGAASRVNLSAVLA